MGVSPSQGCIEAALPVSSHQIGKKGESQIADTKKIVQNVEISGKGYEVEKDICVTVNDGLQ